MRRAKPVLTDQELEIMKVIWELGAATVRDVYEALLDRRKIAYTTVMTMMKILEQKGHLRRKLDDRAYVYQPTRPKQQVVRGMVREFVDRVFNGSAQPLLLHLLEDQNLTPKDLDEIARMIPKGAPSRKGDKKPQ
jgi:predicted transcriptional regulator